LGGRTITLHGRKWAVNAYKSIFKNVCPGGKLCPDFFFHEQLAGLYAGKKKQKADFY
jgi:hypothetical protein